MLQWPYLPHKHSGILSNEKNVRVGRSISGNHGLCRCLFWLHDCGSAIIAFGCFAYFLGQALDISVDTHTFIN